MKPKSLIEKNPSARSALILALALGGSSRDATYVIVHELSSRQTAWPILKHSRMPGVPLLYRYFSYRRQLLTLTQTPIQCPSPHPFLLLQCF